MNINQVNSCIERYFENGGPESFIPKFQRISQLAGRAFQGH